MTDVGAKKTVLLAFIAAGAVLAFLVRTVFEFVAGQSAAFNQFYSTDFAKHILPVIIGVGFFIYLQVNKAVRDWGLEVVAEVGKVVWPSQKDTTGMTLVVCVMVAIAGLILGSFDFLSTSFVDLIIR